jgi:ATP-dependent Clp protease protease subunit
MSDQSGTIRAFVYEIDEDTVEAVSVAIDACVSAGQPFLPLQILSPGGSAYAMFALIDLIDSAPIPVCTTVVGVAASAAAILLACGSKGVRYAAPNARIMIHDVQASTGKRTLRATDFSEDAAQAQSLSKAMLAILDKRTGKKAGYWGRKLKALPHSDLTLTAAQAKREGLVDHVGIPMFSMQEQRSVMLVPPAKGK